MQVTIDTRHDTLEEALAVIQLAFARGSEPRPASSSGPGRTGKTKTAAKRGRSSKPAKGTTAPAVRAPAAIRRPHPALALDPMSLLLVRRRSSGRGRGPKGCKSNPLVGCPKPWSRLTTRLTNRIGGDNERPCPTARTNPGT